MPEITLSLPAVIGLLVLFLATGAVLVYLAMGSVSPTAVEATSSPTVTLTENSYPDADASHSDCNLDA